MQFNRNGVQVRQTQPVRALKRITRVVSIDSRDRDPTKYVRVNGNAAGQTTSDPGDYVVYLPRSFSNVTRLRLKDAIINSPPSGWTSNDQYIMMGIEGLNRMDETAPGADRAGYADYSFAKLVNVNQVQTTTGSSNAIFYNDQTYDANITHYNPPIGTLDRFHITFRRHLPYSGISNIGAPATPFNGPITFGAGENSLTFEIEYLDNVFEDVSSFETFLQSTQGVPR